MKKFIYLTAVLITMLISCEPQQMETGKIGPAPINAAITTNATDPHNPIFTAHADNGYIFHWDMGNGQTIAPGTNTATSYYPFVGTYTVGVTIYGEGAQEVLAETSYKVTKNDPEIAKKPVWKELTGGGTGRTWVYNTNPATGKPDYCYQTTGDLVNYKDNWMPSASWGQCDRITPDINGEMTFDLNDGANYTYHHVAGDAGVKGTFILDTEKMTLTVKDPFILDHNAACTNAAAAATGVYQIKKLTDDELVLWQMQTPPTSTPGSGVGWGWSFKRKP